MSGFVQLWYILFLYAVEYIVNAKFIFEYI